MNVFDLFATLTLDDEEYRKKLNEDEDEASERGSRIGSIFGTAGKAVVAGLSAAAAGVGLLVKSSVGAYADYEQLVGGVETLFSSLDGSVSAASDVMANAANAYKTAGLSANEYMETVTSFSAALVSSLEGDYSKAAAVSDMAITDMSDNANKMGTSMEAIQNAYQGFAKQNYTMLDNLKLGYGGTKTEMERLLADAEKFSGVHYDIDNLSDVYEAIHVVQTEMGITGTTAKEAASTISGSTAMMKSAWSNLMVGIADDEADFDTLVSNFVDSVGTMADNILPRISTALKGVGKLVEALAPQIARALPTLISNVLPSLLSAASTLLQSFVGAISSNLPIIIQEAVPILMALAEGILQNLPLLVESALQIIVMLATGISDALPKLIPTIVDVVIQIVDTLIDNADLLIDAALQIIIALAEGLIKSLPKLLAKAPEIIASLVGAIIGAVGQLLQAAGSIISTLAGGIASRFSVIVGKGRELLQAFKSGVVSAVGSLASAGLNLVQGIWNGISNGLGWIKGKIQGWVGNVTSFIKGLFGIHSPSTVMRDQVGKFLALGIGEGFTREMSNVERMMQESMPDLSTAVSVTSDRATVSESSRNPLAEEITALREDIRNMKIYLDTGVLVGAVDKGLGSNYTATRRRALA